MYRKVVLNGIPFLLQWNIKCCIKKFIFTLYNILYTVSTQQRRYSDIMYAIGYTVATFFIYYFIFHCKPNEIPLDATFLYLKQNVIYWPDDDRLRSKHVATV